ncbi:hypothetical protein CXQ81_17435 [Pseudomonas sp. 09C 129]|uniref:Uncharacterized protein n=1 Tax=Pseudomonas chlororaphis TaxID=587753 RepID=A0AB34C4Z0_9PSED|nr:hypothetical protein CXQ81_17435 [Pseudomonas sp. 09C 129]KAA5841757.1 hypothetical protein F2A38_14535 [Pseudomonas chlororaphis]
MTLSAKTHLLVDSLVSHAREQQWAKRFDTRAYKDRETAGLDPEYQTKSWAIWGDVIIGMTMKAAQLAISKGTVAPSLHMR